MKFFTYFYTYNVFRKSKSKKCNFFCVFKTAKHFTSTRSVNIYLSDPDKIRNASLISHRRAIICIIIIYIRRLSRLSPALSAVYQAGTQRARINTKMISNDETHIRSVWNFQRASHILLIYFRVISHIITSFVSVTAGIQL